MGIESYSFDLPGLRSVRSDYSIARCVFFHPHPPPPLSRKCGFQRACGRGPRKCSFGKGYEPAISVISLRIWSRKVPKAKESRRVDTRQCGGRSMVENVSGKIGRRTLPRKYTTGVKLIGNSQILAPTIVQELLEHRAGLGK